jgi:hypothetical protein
MAVCAGTALADSSWVADMKDGTDTSSRQQTGGCTFRAGPASGSLVVVCPKGASATITYLFYSDDRIEGVPTASFDFTTKQLLKVRTSLGLKDSHHILRVRLVVTGSAMVTINSVGVTYYTE